MTAGSERCSITCFLGAQRDGQLSTVEIEEMEALLLGGAATTALLGCALSTRRRAGPSVPCKDQVAATSDSDARDASSAGLSQSQAALTRASGRAAGGFVAIGIAALVVDSAMGLGGSGAQCSQPVMHNLKWGTSEDYDLANRICCHNTRFAEPSGYFDTKNFFHQVLSAAHAEGRDTTVFYDSQCGLPLFEAPIGRSFFDWQEESVHHGWPSFRAAEIISENVVIHSGGEMASTCGTHLGNFRTAIHNQLRVWSNCY